MLTITRLVHQVEPLDKNLDTSQFAPDVRDALEAIKRSNGHGILRAFLDACNAMPLERGAPLRDAVLTADPHAEDETRQRALELALPQSWSVTDLLEHAFPPQVWLVDGLLSTASFAALGGKKKGGKTWLALQLAQAVALGAPFLGRTTSPCRVHYAMLEDGARRTKQRLKLQRAAEEAAERLENLSFTFGPYLPLNDGGIEQFRFKITTEKLGLFIIDTLAAAKSAAIDENDNNAMADLFNNLHRVAQETGCCLLIVAHHGKTVFEDPGFDLRGASAIPGATDINIGLYVEGREGVLKAEGKDLDQGTELALSFDGDYSFAWQVTGDTRNGGLGSFERRIMDMVDLLSTADAGQIAQEIGRERNLVARALTAMAEQQILERTVVQMGKDRTRLVYRIHPSYRG